MESTEKGEFPLYNAADLARRRQGLVNKGRAEEATGVIQRQLALAEAAENSSATFLSWFEGVAVERKSQPLSFRSPNRPLTGQEVANPPLETEWSHYSLLDDLPPRLAALPSFWTSYQLEMVRRELVDPADFATPISSTNETGRARLQKAIRRSRKNLLDQCTRTVLRQLGGLPEVRGYVTVFVDCRLSRAWWRGHISHQVATDMNVDVERVWVHLRLADATWDQLQQYTVRRLTVVGDRNVRSALIARLMESRLDQESSKIRRQRTQAFFARVGARSAHQALGALSPDQNLLIFRGMDV